MFKGQIRRKVTVNGGLQPVAEGGIKNEFRKNGDYRYRGDGKSNIDRYLEKRADLSAKYFRLCTDADKIRSAHEEMGVNASHSGTDRSVKRM